MAIVLTLLTATAAAAWRSWRDRHIGQQTGTLAVESHPAGAAILIDGIERGTSPIALALTPGRHEVVAKSALGMGRTSLDIAIGQQHKVVVALEFGTDPGSIDISTDPPGAQVRLDGEDRGRSPVSLDEVAPGEHVLHVEHGAARMERRFVLAPAERLTVYVPLAGWVAVRAGVPLQVLDRGKSAGVTTEGRLLVPAGRRRLQFVNEEFGVNTTQDVVVRAGQVAEVAVSLPAGVLSVSSDVAADVAVDGRAIGQTPTGNTPVSIGEHEVVVSHPQWGEQRLTVVVGLGAPTRLDVKLSGPLNSRSGGQRGSPKRSGISAAR